jgi:hypothetical protein
MEDIVCTKIEYALNGLIDDPTDLHCQAIKEHAADFFKLRKHTQNYWEKIKILYADLKTTECKVYAASFIDRLAEGRDQLSSFQYDDVSPTEKIVAWLDHLSVDESEVSDKFQDIAAEINKTLKAASSGTNFALISPHENGEKLIGLMLSSRACGSLNSMSLGLV